MLGAAVYRASLHQCGRSHRYLRSDQIDQDWNLWCLFLLFCIRTEGTFWITSSGFWPGVAETWWLPPAPPHMLRRKLVNSLSLSLLLQTWKVKQGELVTFISVAIQVTISSHRQVCVCVCVPAGTEAAVCSGSEPGPRRKLLWQPNTQRRTASPPHHDCLATNIHSDETPALQLTASASDFHDWELKTKVYFHRLKRKRSDRKQQ